MGMSLPLMSTRRILGTVSSWLLPAGRMLCLSCLLLGFVLSLRAVPATGATITLNELSPGMEGQVWTVFRGTEPEPFSVRVTGVLRNALGPGKSMIVCELTDPRVQSMGATSGMSGSPLYIDGRLAGALSYQIQRFETVRYAGFTPVGDLQEVGSKTAAGKPASSSSNLALSTAASGSEFSALRPAFAAGGLSPQVAALMAPEFERLGLGLGALGGSLDSASSDSQSAAAGQIKPGAPVAVALSTGDISLAGTGTVSMVEGQRVTAFGHPMLGMGEVDLPMCSAEILTILPSTMNSVKLANVGPVIGTLSQDRLSAVSGTLGAGPRMIDIEVGIKDRSGPGRSLHFRSVRHPQLTPLIVAIGVMQGVTGSNENGLSEGFRVRTEVSYPGQPVFSSQTVQAGPQAFIAALREFMGDLSLQLYNPYERVFPDRITVQVEPLAENPLAFVENLRLSGTQFRPGDTLQAMVVWRDFQGVEHNETLSLPVSADWTGRQLELVLASGQMLDQLSGHGRQLQASQFRSFDSLLEAMKDGRAGDGLYLAVVERAGVFADESRLTVELPGSLERIARRADESRFQRSEALTVLKELHFMNGRLCPSALRRPISVVD